LSPHFDACANNENLNDENIIKDTGKPPRSKLENPYYLLG
jgi:hypothetical protein